MLPGIIKKGSKLIYKPNMLSYDNVMVLMITTPEGITILEVGLMTTMHENKQVLNIFKQSCANVRTRRRS